MGNIISTASSGLGETLGNIIAAPIKLVFSENCDDVCAGTWDIGCFIEHFCISNIFMVCGLSFVTLFFVYLLYKIGIIQCVCKMSFKMTWALFKAYFKAMGKLLSLLWHKIRNTKRVYRSRYRYGDLEQGFSSSNDDSYDSYDYNHSSRYHRKRGSVRERRKHRVRKSLSLRRSPSIGKRRKYRTGTSTSVGTKRHHFRVKTRDISLHLKGSIGHRRHKHIHNHRVKGHKYH